MSSKSSISKQQWSSFWKKSGIYLLANDREYKKYSWQGLKRRLLSKGIDDELAEKTKRIFDKYKAPDLQLLRFCKFFLNDSLTIQIFFEKKDIPSSFLSLSNTFRYKSYENLENIFKKIVYLRELNRKGQGYLYTTNTKVINNISGYRPKDLQRWLSRFMNDQYRFLDRVELRGWNVFIFRRGKGNNPIYKFLQVKKTRNKLDIKISADSKKETNIIRNHLARYFNAYIDCVEIKNDFKKIERFIKTGSSESFNLLGLTSYNGDFEVTIMPKFSKFRTDLGVSNSEFFQQIKIKVPNLKIIHLIHNELKGKKLTIFLRSFTNSGILGAVLFDFNDRKLNPLDRQKVFQDFEKDFDISMGAFVKNDELNEKYFCETFLCNSAKRYTPYSIRDKRGMEVLSLLKKLNFFDKEKDEFFISYFCFNKGCLNYCKPQDVGSLCGICKSPLYANKEIIINNINEESIARYIKTKFDDFGYRLISNTPKELLKRKIHLIEGEKNGKTILLLPLTEELSNNQLELLSHRFPDVHVVTSKDDVSKLKSYNIMAIELHKLFYKIQYENKDIFTLLSNEIKRESITKIENLANEVSRKIGDNSFYSSKNAGGNNLGAELFEAHCHVLLRSMFGFSSWLGTTKRGKAVPDGKSAFPIFPGVKNGLFIWDSKFYSKPFSCGGFKKNDIYVSSFKKNKYVKSKGGLKSLIFISNKKPNGSFAGIAKKLTKNRRLKIVVVSNKNLLDIFNHFKTYKESINSNIKSKRSFYNWLYSVFCSTKKDDSGKVCVYDDLMISNKIEINKTELEELLMGQNLE
ncbi:MAG TPA: hypothetical protein P5096_00080 [Patescibacteria group bacterium]|nr:hypothetical protein [Patescibacteria group bacterium]